MRAVFNRGQCNANRACSMLTILHLSIIAAFIASILDLSQILQRGRLNTDLGLDLDTVQSLITAREVGYALSNSLRFLFFWIFVAEPPKTERNARAGAHSGNWNAWGFIGIILQYSTLGLTLTVFALQVVWRIDNRFNSFTPLYTADSAIQVVLSAVFVLKLVLNCIHCATISRRTCLVDYLGFIVSLLFGAGFGVTNLMDCESLFGFVLTIHSNTQSAVEFTETVLGRFLQGVNFYVLVLSSLLTVFMLPGSHSGRVPSFRPLSPKQPASSFNVTPPDVSTPNLSAIQPRPSSPVTQRPQVERSSSTAKLSEWVATQRKRLSSLSFRGGQDDLNVNLWGQNQAERGQSFWEDPSGGSDESEKIYPDSYVGADKLPPPPTEKPGLETVRVGKRSTKSISSLYSDSGLEPPEMVDRRSLKADSPVFGLYGIVRSPGGRSKMDSPQGSVTVADPDQSSDISDLFRKQEELDKTIAALKLLDADLPNSPSSSKQSREPSTARSDFSLSNFPNPPWVDPQDSDNLSTPRLSFGSTRTARPSHSKLPSVSVNNVPFDLIPPRMPASMMEHNRTLSVPISETAESEMPVSARTRFDSQGTQYDVTSFIGSMFLGFIGFSFAHTLTDLTGPSPPGHKKDLSGSSNTTDDVASSWSDDTEPAATIVTLQQSKQTYVGSPLARMPVIVSTTPGILPATRVMLPSKPKLDISQPQPAVPRLRQDVSWDTFERPRAVPSVYR